MEIDGLDPTTTQRRDSCRGNAQNLSLARLLVITSDRANSGRNDAS
jgi:hypothetical protein